MTRKTKHGLTYFKGDADEGIAKNIDVMGHPDKSVRATARLNRDLVAAIERWISDERQSGALPLDVLPGAMHGVITVCGSLLLNMPDDVRKRAHATIRAHLLEIFDAMGEAIMNGDGP